jgi:hypothetical protein
VSLTSYRRLVRASAIYDLLVTAPFATPWTFAWVHGWLGKVAPLPEFQSAHMLFANLLGSLVLVWASLRVWRPEPVFGLFDAVARGLFFSWQVYFLFQGVAYFVALFAVFELAFGVAQAWGYWRLSAAERGLPKAMTVVGVGV